MMAHKSAKIELIAGGIGVQEQILYGHAVHLENISKTYQVIELKETSGREKLKTCWKLISKI